MTNKYHIREANEEDIKKLVLMRLELQKHMSENNPHLWEISAKKISEQPDFYRGMIIDQNAKLLVIQETENQSMGAGH